MIIFKVLLSTILMYFFISWIWRKLWKPKEPPLLRKYSLPLVGNIPLFIGNTIDLWSKFQVVANYTTKNGGVVKGTVGTLTLYMLTDPEVSFSIGTSFLQKDRAYDMAKPWLGEGLLTAQVDIWKRHRKLVNPSFRQQVIEGYLTVFNSQSKCLVDRLAKEVGKGYFDHVPYSEQTALEIIFLTAMGIEDNDSDGVAKNDLYIESVSRITNLFVERVQKVLTINDFLFSFTAMKKKQDALIKILHGTSNEVIQRRKSAHLINNRTTTNNYENTPKRFKSFLDLLLESSMDGSLSDQEIREEVDTMIGAGSDTAATLLTFALVTIGSYPEVQDRAYQEVQQVLEGADRDIEKYDLPKLVYLEAVLKETMRLYPVIPLVARHLDKNVELKNCTLLAGSSCIILLHGILNHPMWGSDRNVFRPERWLHLDDLPKSANAFASFGVGRRTCIGQQFVMMSIKTTLCHILRKYRVFADVTKMVNKMNVVLKAHSGHFIRVETR